MHRDVVGAVSIKVLKKPSDSGQFPEYGHPEPMGVAIYDFVSLSAVQLTVLLRSSCSSCSCFSGSCWPPHSCVLFVAEAAVG